VGESRDGVFAGILIDEVDSVVRLLSQFPQCILRVVRNDDLAFRKIEIELRLTRVIRASFDTKDFSHGVEIRTGGSGREDDVIMNLKVLQGKVEVHKRFQTYP